MTEPQMMTAQDMAAYLNVHEMTVYRWLERGLIPATKIGGRWRARKETIDTWLDQRSNFNETPVKKSQI